MKSIRVIFVAGLLVVAAAAPSIGETPTVTVRGDRFVKNGEAKYLLFVSYFDAMRRAGSSVDGSGNPTGDLDTDFAYLQTHGIDGIRIFPNWWHWCPEPKRPAADDALFTISGGLRAETDPIWKRFVYVLNKAAEHDLLVDVSFTAETLTGNHLGDSGGLTLASYQDQIAGVASRLRNGFPHVFFDLHNEYTNNGVERQTELIPIALDITNDNDGDGDPGRLITASATDPGDAGEAARVAQLDFAAAHGNRLPTWYTGSVISDLITATRNASHPESKPVYLQEPHPFAAGCRAGDDSAPEPFHYRQAASNAKVHGAAAFTFHSRTTFDLATGTYYAKMHPLVNGVPAKTDEAKELEALRDAVNAVAWGNDGSASDFIDTQPTAARSAPMGR
jgi:hypothetical protein